MRPLCLLTGQTMGIHAGAGGGQGGGLGDDATSPGLSPSKGYSHSAHTSPTNTAKLRPPRARYADTDNKKQLVR